MSRRDQDGRIVGASGEGENQEVGTDAAAESALLHFSSPRDAATIAAYLRTRVYPPEFLVWLGATGPSSGGGRKRHHRQHAVPYDTETEAGVTKAFPLGPAGAPAAQGLARRGARGLAQGTAGCAGGRDSSSAVRSLGLPP